MGAGGQRGLRDPEDIQAIIDRILASPRAQETRAFSSRTFADEPILRRGSQMPGYLPERCREMRELAQSPELRGRPEAYVFYRQARLMADYEDDLPYHGTFEHYFPTYQAMSNRQLRGYFTWRATVRRGDVRRTSLSFAFVYLYELLCDVGVEPGEQGFRAIERFWWAYRGLEPRIDRYVRRWLRDYAVWHDLPHALVEPYVSLSFDRALVALRDGIASWEGRPPARGLATPLGLIVPREREGLAAPAGSDAGAGAWAGGADKDAGVGAHAARSGADGAGLAGTHATGSGQAGVATGGRGRRAHGAGGADNPAEQAMFDALDELSSYRPRVSRLHRDRPDTLRHVTCAVIVELARHYDAHRKAGLVETLFGSPLAMPYEMFASAVFWSDGPHADASYELDEVNRYTCARGRWYWEGYHGDKGRSPKLGAVVRAVDQRLRDAIGYEHPLVQKPVPKYLAKIIDREVEARLAWEREREARTIRVDLSQLAGIRAAASVTRDALLVDEEVEDAPAADAAGLGDVPETEGVGQPGDGQPADPRRRFWSSAPSEEPQTPEASTPAEGPADASAAPAEGPTPAEGPADAGAAPAADGPAPYGLAPVEIALLRTLLDGRPYAAPAGTSVDMLVDDINERLFDLLGDTALEFDGDAPTLVEDYAPDVRAALEGA